MISRKFDFCQTPAKILTSIFDFHISYHVLPVFLRMDTGATFRSELTCKSRLVPMSDGQVNRDSEGRPYGQIMHPRKQSLGPTRQLEAVEFPKLKSRGPVSRLRPFIDIIINININDTTMTMTTTVMIL